MSFIAGFAEHLDIAEVRGEVAVSKGLLQSHDGSIIVLALFDFIELGNGADVAAGNDLLVTPDHIVDGDVVPLGVIDAVPNLNFPVQVVHLRDVLCHNIVDVVVVVVPDPSGGFVPGSCVWVPAWPPEGSSVVGPVSLFPQAARARVMANVRTSAMILFIF